MKRPRDLGSGNAGEKEQKPKHNYHYIRATVNV
jgi:hypothetical protein